MAAPVIVEWIVKGIPDIQRAARSVSDTVLASERASTRSVEREAAKRLKATEQEAKRRNAIRERSATMAGQYAAQAANKEMRATEQAERAKTRTVEQEERRRLAIRERSATMAGQFAVREAAKEARAREQAARQEHATRRQFATTIMGAGAAAGRNVARGLGRGAGYLGSTVAQLGGGFSVADAVNERSQLERESIKLANKAILPGGGRASKNAILSKVKASSIATGTDEAEMLKAWGAYTDKTGDFEGGQKNLDFFGKLAKGTGSDLSQVATTAGILKVQNKNLDEKGMKNLLLSTVAAGRLGSVDMPELTKHAGDITKTSSSYAGDQATNQQNLLGMAQVGMRTGSISEVAAMLSNIAGDAGKHSKEITAALGPGTFNKKGQIAKSGPEFVADVLEKTGGNRQKINALGFNNRSLKYFDALLPTYNDAEKKALKGGASQKEATKAAKAAALADQTQFTGATMTQESLDKDFAEIMKSSAEQFELAVRSLKTEIGEKLLPEFVKLIPILQRLVPPLTDVMDAMIKLANWAATNPFSGLAAAVTIAITSELAKAAIGQTIKNMLSGGGAPGSPGVPTPGGGAPGAPGAPGGGLVQGVAVLAGVALAVTRAGDLADKITGGGAAASAVENMAKNGDVAGAQKALADAQKTTAGGGSSAMSKFDLASKGANLMFNPIGALGEYATGKALGTEDRETKQINAQAIVDSEGIRKAISAAVAAGANDAKAGTAPGAPNRGSTITARQP